jgi:hypothetical protein
MVQNKTRTGFPAVSTEFSASALNAAAETTKAIRHRKTNACWMVETEHKHSNNGQAEAKQKNHRDSKR